MIRGAQARFAGVGEKLAQKDVQEADPPPADVASAAARLVREAQPVVLDFEEAPVVGEALREVSRLDGARATREFAFRVGEDFFKVRHT